MHEDGHLIDQVRKGDLRAFEGLYDKYKGHVYRTAMAIVGDSSAAEDILQDCFVRLHANIDRIDGSVPILPWLHRVTVNLAYNYVARRKRWAGSLDALLETVSGGLRGAPDRAIERSETQQSLRAAIDALHFRHRIVVILFYQEAFSLEEIAYILDCPVGTVKSRLHYARNKLRSHLEGQRPAFEIGYEPA